MKIMYRIHKFNRNEHMSKEEEKDEKEIFSVSIISNYGAFARAAADLQRQQQQRRQGQRLQVSPRQRKQPLRQLIIRSEL